MSIPTAFIASVVIAVLLAIAYVFGELQCYKRVGDVWGWTVKLANFLKRF